MNRARPHFVAPVQIHVGLFAVAAAEQTQLAGDRADLRVREIRHQMREGLRVEGWRTSVNKNLAGGLSESEIYGRCFAAVRCVDEVNPGVTLDDVRRRVGGAVGIR